MYISRRVHPALSNDEALQTCARQSMRAKLIVKPGRNYAEAEDITTSTGQARVARCLKLGQSSLAQVVNGPRFGQVMTQLHVAVWQSSAHAVHATVISSTDKRLKRFSLI